MDGLSKLDASGRSEPLRILLSAYACEPGKGSEPGIGWKWATELAAAGHRICVITRANNRPAIERAMSTRPVSALAFSYYDLPRWASWWKRGGRGVHLYYFLWQWGAFRHARRLCAERPFDLVHHITFGVFRQPSFMPFLGLPFVFGPVGGGERAPRSLCRGATLRGRAVSWLRELANRLTRCDPLMHAVLRRSAVILCKTCETLERIPPTEQERCRVMLELGTASSVQSDPQPLSARTLPTRPEILYVGRLVYFKGLHLALPAFARLLEVRPDARFTIVGDGPEAGRLRRLAARLGVEKAVRWLPWLEHAEVLSLYPASDLLLFPSLHDSSGNVVLEAMSRGLPVVCLDLGGPAVIVDEHAGIRVAAPDPATAIAGLAAAMQSLLDDTDLHARLSRGARERACAHFSWRRQTERMSEVYASLLAGPAGARGLLS